MFRWLQGKRKRGADGSSGNLVTLLDPSGRASEAYRTLRTSLFYSLADVPPKVIVITSAGPEEGKSTTCANLGVVLAQAEKSTLIVDCDLRKPTQHKIFELRNLHGLMNVLTGEETAQELWQEPLKGLKVLTVGPLPPNPAEVLSSQRFSQFLSQVRQDFDYVLLDAPPVQLVSDPAILAPQGDGVLLILDAQKSRKVTVRQAVRSLEAVGANVLGTVMNYVPESKTGYYGGYTYK